MSDTANSNTRNPFADHDANRHQIWEILMRHDFEAFVAGDWSMIQDDFWEEGFCGIDARKHPEPSQWRLTFSTVAAYRGEWLRQVQEFALVRLLGTTVLDFLYDSCCLEDIEIVAERAIARKKFEGTAKTVDGEDVVLRFQTLYQLIRRHDRWLIAGFVGYLPHPMPAFASANNSEVPW